MREAVRRQHRVPEAEAVARLRRLQPDEATSRRIGETALRLARSVRAALPGVLSAESFLRAYGLTTREGVALMCVAEALLRIPDAATQDALIRDKLASGSWSSASAADWALMLTGTLARWHDAEEESFSTLKQLIARLGNIDHHDALMHVHLRRGKADAGRCIHGFRHVAYQSLDVGRDGRHRRRNFPQSRVRVFENSQ